MSTTTTASPSATSTDCVTATPGKYGYVPPEACNSNWAYSPNFGAAIFFSVLFGITTVTHTIQAIIYRKRFCWVIIMASSWELIAFVLRSLASHNQQNLGYATASQLLILLAPLWINAFAYMVLGRMIHYYVPVQRVFGVRAESLAKYFIWLDIFTFLIQVVGGGMVGPGSDPQTVKIGLNVYMGGIGLQQLFICIFTVILIKFHLLMPQLIREPSLAGKRGWKTLTWSLYVVLALITVRIIFRLVEYSSGIKPSNPLPFNEGYVLGLDAMPMVIAVAVHNVLHPGRFLEGPESEFPKLSRKEKKQRKAEKKQEKRERREQKKRGHRANDVEMA